MYRATRETKLQSLHFKRMNRVVPCREFLKQIRLADMDACKFCGSWIPFPTSSSPALALAICQWFERVEDFQLDSVPIKKFLFGLPPTDNNAKKINAILMAVKFYIYRQRLFNEVKLELHWLNEFKFRLRVSNGKLL